MFSTTKGLSTSDLDSDNYWCKFKEENHLTRSSKNLFFYFIKTIYIVVFSNIKKINISKLNKKIIHITIIWYFKRKINLLNISKFNTFVFFMQGRLYLNQSLFQAKTGALENKVQIKKSLYVLELRILAVMTYFEITRFFSNNLAPAEVNVPGQLRLPDSTSHKTKSTLEILIELLLHLQAFWCFCLKISHY